jgi:hypothetical protein
MPLPPSAADWTRFQKLRQSLMYEADLLTNKDIISVVTPPGCTPCSSRAGVRRDQDSIAGSSKTRREASKWIDYKAGILTDFVTVQEYPGAFGRKQMRTQLCASNAACVTTVLNPRVGVLRSSVYQHSRIL